jgi:hypothetical protein
MYVGWDRIILVAHFSASAKIDAEKSRHTFFGDPNFLGTPQKSNIAPEKEGGVHFFVPPPPKKPSTFQRKNQGGMVSGSVFKGLGWQLYGQIGRLFAPQNAVHIEGG